MTLKDKFFTAIRFTSISKNRPEICAEIAEDFAIGFAEYIYKKEYNMKYYIELKDTKQLLEIYKKEKGLQ